VSHRKSAISERSPAPASDQLSTATRSNRALFRRFRRTRDPRVREVLVRRFLPLARKLARRYYGGGEPLEDLVQVASLGLVKAVDRYDESRGVSFSSYAVPTISGELKRYFRDHAWSVHVPRGMRERAIEVDRVSRQLAGATGRTPSGAEVADRAGIGVADVDAALEAYAAFDSLSLDAPTSTADEPDPQPRAETIGVEDERYELTEERLAIGDAVRRLPDQERRILSMRYGENRTQADIAESIGVSQMQVSRVLRRTLERLQRTVEWESRPAARRYRTAARG